MNDASSFSRVSRSSQVLYGPRKILICGLTPEGQAAFDDVMAIAAIQALPLIYARSNDLEISMADILTHSENTGRDEPSRMPAAIIMSGITENELHQLISSYRKVGMPEPLWATLTPTSEGWTLRQLLTELSAEQQAMKEKQSSNL
jgi:hypothetical protein